MVKCRSCKQTITQPSIPSPKWIDPNLTPFLSYLKVHYNYLEINFKQLLIVKYFDFISTAWRRPFSALKSQCKCTEGFSGTRLQSCWVSMSPYPELRSYTATENPLPSAADFRLSLNHHHMVSSWTQTLKKVSFYPPWYNEATVANFIIKP